jgi:hypothetical protein
MSRRSGWAMHTSRQLDWGASLGVGVPPSVDRHRGWIGEIIHGGGANGWSGLCLRPYGNPALDARFAGMVLE